MNSELDKVRRRTQDALDYRKSAWDPHWRLVDEMFSTRRNQFLYDAGSQPRKYQQNTAIIRNHAVICRRRFAAGLQAGITSPARPWAVFVPQDKELLKNHAVADWCVVVKDIVMRIIRRSGLYSVFSQFYSDIGFGTACIWTDEHPETVIQGRVMPLGTYCLGANSRGEVDTIYCWHRYDARQMLEKFPRNAVTQSVRTADENKNYSIKFEVVHAVEPNPGFDDRRMGLGVEGKRFISRWWQPEGRDFLTVGGYHEFPAITPRWEVSGEEVYGIGPFLDALSDVKELQHHAKSKLQAIDKWIRPPLALPSSAEGRPVSLLPDGRTYIDGIGTGFKVERLVDIQPASITAVGQEMAEIKSAISAATYADLFLLFAESDRRQVTAEEIRAKQDEKMLQIGPAFSQLDFEFLRRILDRAFYAAARRGLIPPAPEELRNVPIDIEYLNLMSQAQRLVQSAGEREFVAFVGNALAIAGPGSPEAAEISDNVAWDEIVREHAQTTSVPPDFLRTPEQVAARRQARAEAQAQAQQAAIQAQQAGAVRDLASASLEDNNMLTAQLGGPVPGLGAS